MSASTIMSAIAENRKNFFELIEAAERECNCKIDDAELEAVIDSEFDGQTKVSDEQAQHILMLASRPTVARGRV